MVMELMMQDEAKKLAPDELKILTEAVSAQTKVSNRAWFALVAFALIIVLPSVEPDKVTLPLGLPEVPADEFYTFALPFLTVLMVYFCQAYAQEVRGSRLAQRLIDMSSAGGALHPRDVFDLLRVPSVNRVAPLPQAFSGQFYSLRDTASKMHRWLAAIYYVLLKLFATLVYIGIPVVALVSAVSKFHEITRETNFLKGVEIVSYVFLGLALIAFLEVVVLEIVNLGKAAKAVFRGNSEW